MDFAPFGGWADAALCVLLLLVSGWALFRVLAILVVLGRGDLPC